MLEFPTQYRDKSVYRVKYGSNIEPKMATLLENASNSLDIILE